MIYLLGQILLTAQHTQTHTQTLSDLWSKLSNRPTITLVTQQHNQQSYHCAAPAEKRLFAAIPLHNRKYVKFIRVEIRDCYSSGL